ncbi:MAG: ABC transporter permease [Lachnospiraceae bacterium]|nr:ABC transporter permease [Lachnospiraceae bacterium]
MYENQFEKYSGIPAEKFQTIDTSGRITDKKLSTKPVGYFRDAMGRFRKNKSSVAAAIIILLLLLYAIIIPMISHYDVTFRDGYYKLLLPHVKGLEWLGIDGCMEQNETQAGYDYYNSILYEVDPENTAVKDMREHYKDMNGIDYYRLYVDTYDKVGFAYVDMTEQQYLDLQAYQNENNIQVIYPLPANYKTNYVAVTSGANLWYELKDSGPNTQGESAYHEEDGTPIYVPAYHTSKNEHRAKYDSLRIAGDDGGENGTEWYTYAVKNQSGYRMRVLYSEYYRYSYGFYASHPLGTNQHGQDLLVCLAAGARLSFILAISVSILNFFIGVIFGSISGYYGGWVDLVLERVTDILSGVPFIVVATLFQLHLADKVGVVVCLLFAFITTGWIGIAYRVRTQFYRFKNQEHILAARTLGASDARLMFRHILPNSLGTIITGTILIIPSVIFSESMLSYLHIISLETSGLTSIGTMLSNGQAYLSTYPHILLFPAIFISLLMISFNLFGNGLRDAFNPSLRGVDE